MNLIAEYIKYRLKAKKRHGIHSPFVYELSDQVFRHQISYNDLTIIQMYRNQLKRDQRIIEVRDFGAGSKKMGNQRKVSSIFKTSSAGNFGKRLYQLSNHFKPTRVLELGTSLGFGSLHLALGNPGAEIISIEGCSNTAVVAAEMLKNHKNIDIRIGQFSEIIPSLSGQFDLIYLDGHHNGQATLDYLAMLESHIHNESLIVLDDIRWSADMFEAWNSLVNHDKWHVTIDLFRTGIILNRDFQEKEHFFVRY